MQLPVHSYRLNSVTAANSRLLNCYAETIPEGKQPIRLTRAPGIADLATFSVGIGRGLEVMAGSLYAVVGGSLYSVSSSGTETLLGSVSSLMPTSMANNGTQLVVGTDGGSWYVYDGTFSQITDTDFTSRGARSCAFIDNYIAFVEPGSGRWFVCDLANASSYDSLNFATAEGSPDRLVTLIVDHREV